LLSPIVGRHAFRWLSGRSTAETAWFCRVVGVKEVRECRRRISGPNLATRRARSETLSCVVNRDAAIYANARQAPCTTATVAAALFKRLDHPTNPANSPRSNNNEAADHAYGPPPGGYPTGRRIGSRGGMGQLRRDGSTRISDLHESFRNERAMKCGG
jgi:hypothetical protein